MKTIVTSKGKTYPVDYCGISYQGWVKAQIRDSRRLSEIAPELEGLELIELVDSREQEPEQIERFEGYTILKRLEWVDDRSVIALLARPEEETEETEHAAI